MKSRAKNIAIIFFFIFIFLNFKPAFADSSKIIYQTETNYPPLKFMENGHLVGFEMDLSNLIFGDNKYTVQYSTGAFSDILDRIKNGQIDTCGLVAINNERKGYMLFSNPVLSTTAGIYTRSNGPDVSESNLKNYRIGIIKDDYTENIIKNNVGIQNQNVKSYGSFDDAIDALEKGEIDAFFGNEQAFNFILIQKQLKGDIILRVSGLYPVEVAYGVNKDNPDLIKYINNRISELQSSGEYDRLYNKYFLSTSPYLIDNHRKMALEITGAVLAIGFIIFLLLQIYIRHLKKNLSQTNNELKNRLEELRLREEQYILVLDGANDGIWDWDMVKNHVHYSSRYKEMFGLRGDKVEDDAKFWSNRIHPDDKEQSLKNLYDYIGKKITAYRDEYRLRTEDGQYKWILSRGKAIWDDAGKPIRMAGSHTDITEHKRADAMIEKMAYFDYLTGLPNRVLLTEIISQKLTNAHNKKKQLAILFMDLDNFKSINDTLGHAAGDQMLKVIAERIRDCICEDDIVARLSGDEFVFIIENIEKAEDVTARVDTIFEELKKPILLNEREMYITASIGISIYPQDGDDEETLLKNADISMYSAKESGKNNYMLFNKQMNIEIVEKLKLENDLINAIKNEEFLVYYQPQIEISSGEIAGVEALVRWQHPAQGLIPPVKFIPLAEETGLIIPIGEYVLRKACEQNKKWQDMGYKPMTVAVNLSAKQFEQDNLLGMIENVLKETGMEPMWLDVEITESIAMKNFNLTIDTISKLRQMNVRVSLDDFGTGYSSLNYLKQLPIDSLKIDKTFLHNISLNSNEEIIAKSIIDLAQKMKLVVIAEGVETENQLKFLKEQACNKAQGYIFSAPIGHDGIEEMLQRGRFII